jgi:2-haloacid dehalogenase
MTQIQALTFDVGGTVFDWKSTVRKEVESWAQDRGVKIDSEAFAMDWRKRMFEILGEVRSGVLPRMNADEMHRRALDDLNMKYASLSLLAPEMDQINQAWHRMAVWLDFPEAMTRLKEHYRVVVLTVLSFAIVVDCSKANGITWDGIISCEFLSHYKPEAEAYLSACRLLGLQPEQVMMVAAHPLDLKAAKEAGLRAAFVEPKLKEPELAGFSAEPIPSEYDYNAEDFTDLAAQLC